MAGPEPLDFSDCFVAGDTPVRIRLIRPDDRDREMAFVRGLSARSRYYRFHAALRELTPELLERFTHLDYPDHLALVALVDTPGGEQQIGVARYVREPGSDSAEIAIVVADAWQGKGIATRLLTDLRTLAQQVGVRRLVASVLRENGRMLSLVRHLGFEGEPSGGDPRTSFLGKRLAGPDDNG